MLARVPHIGWVEHPSAALVRFFVRALEGKVIPVQNAEIAECLERYADLLAIEAANPFRVRAYRNAAMTIRSAPRRLAEMVEWGEDPAQLHGVGKTIAAKIVENPT